jgi:hypothetical protein
MEICHYDCTDTTPSSLLLPGNSLSRYRSILRGLYCWSRKCRLLSSRFDRSIDRSIDSTASPSSLLVRPFSFRFHCRRIPDRGQKSKNAPTDDSCLLDCHAHFLVIIHLVSASDLFANYIFVGLLTAESVQSDSCDGPVVGTDETVQLGWASSKEGVGVIVHPRPFKTVSYGPCVHA